MRFWLALLLMGCAVPAWAAHAYALWGAPRYPAGFAHFDYVNPDAPKGGELRLVSNLRVSSTWVAKPQVHAEHSTARKTY